MIYKIVMDFQDLQSLIEKLSIDFYVLFYNGVLYICSKNLENVSTNKIKDIIKDDNVFLLCIDEKNIMNESDKIRDWCESYYIQKDIKDFELNNQELIKQYMNILNDCEEQLKEILREEDA